MHNVDGAGGDFTIIATSVFGNDFKRSSFAQFYK